MNISLSIVIVTALIVIFSFLYNLIFDTVRTELRRISHNLVLKPEPFDKTLYAKWINNEHVIREEINTSDGETLDAVLYNKNKKPSYENDIIYLYHHGNSGWLGLVLESSTCEYLSNYGALFIYDYRGYGKSTGKPTDDGLFIDAISVWKFLVGKKKVDPKRIIMFGHSLGTSIAAYLIKYVLEKGDQCCDTLILQNPFESIHRVCNDIVPWIGQFVQLNFRTNEFIKKIDKLTSNLKIYMIHSENDDLIDKNHSFDLAKNIKNNLKRVIIVPGSHDGVNYNNEVHELLLHVNQNTKGINI